jgi:hypothetical protein
MSTMRETVSWFAVILTFLDSRVTDSSIFEVRRQ